ncbi:MAG: hypothetical protein WBH94_01405 [Methanoculleus sp.]|jgi:hypothetical protein
MSDVNDFVETAVNRTAVRDLEYPIGTIEEFDDLVEDFISANPSGCVGYTTNKGVAVPPIFRNREYYSVKVDIAEDGKALGTVSVQVPTIAAYGTVADEIYGNEALEAAIGGESYRAFEKESYYCQLKCHDVSGDDFYVTFTRKAVRISSFSDEAILDAIEAWADAKPELD